MSDLGIGKLGVLIFSVAGIVTIKTISATIRSSLGLKRIIKELKMIESLQHCPSINELPIKRTIRWTKQVNDGKSPCDTSYPDINLQKFLDNFEVISKKSGIW